ncbi:Peptidyl-tRNA hydrolase [Gossypium arboreum]|uniref:Peptidyl-tRNA hydrolase n=1 Tax=Gossypium arboreum TaxID=29729 RepID=A0A0B0NMI3_GOSAR|nr:Peptidyl-tRNA hydrolase [Gossypium arboreum]
MASSYWPKLQCNAARTCKDITSSRLGFPSAHFSNDFVARIANSSAFRGFSPEEIIFLVCLSKNGPSSGFSSPASRESPVPLLNFAPKFLCFLAFFSCLFSTGVFS